MPTSKYTIASTVGHAPTTIFTKFHEVEDPAIMPAPYRPQLRPPMITNIFATIDVVHPQCHLLQLLQFIHINIYAKSVIKFVNNYAFFIRLKDGLLLSNILAQKTPKCYNLGIKILTKSYGK